MIGDFEHQFGHCKCYSSVDWMLCLYPFGHWCFKWSVSNFQMWFESYFRFHNNHAAVWSVRGYALVDRRWQWGNYVVAEEHAQTQHSGTIRNVAVLGRSPEPQCARSGFRCTALPACIRTTDPEAAAMIHGVSLPAVGCWAPVKGLPSSHPYI